MSIRSGIRSALVSGLQSGLNPGDSNPITWSIDGTSSKAVPASNTEWSDLLAYLGLTGIVSVPNSFWLCQEASGNLADSGSGGLTLTAAGTPLYQQTVAGWTRKGVGMSVGDTDAFAAAAGVGPNPTSTSSRWLWFVNVTTPATTRQAAAVGGAAAGSEFSLRVTSTPRYQIKVMTNTANSAGVPDSLMSLLYDRTNSLAVAYSDAEKLAGTYNSGVTDGAKGIGAGITTSVAMSAMYGCMWSGAAAEFSEANYRTLLEGMGFTIGW